MIIRDISIRFGNGLIETTPFTADANVSGESTVIAGLRMKNLTEADCLGSVDLVFLNPEALRFLKKKLQEMEEIWEEHKESEK